MKKKLVRNGVFETNSSSCHSLTVSNNPSDVLTSVTPDEDGVIRIGAYEFGWDYEEYSHACAKLAYVMIYLKDWVREADALARMTSMFKKVVCEHTGATDIEFETVEETPGNCYPYGYIDHQSVESRDLDFLFDNGEAYLRNFLFSDRSFIQTDNDNH